MWKGIALLMGKLSRFAIKIKFCTQSSKVASQNIILKRKGLPQIETALSFFISN